MPLAREKNMYIYARSLRCYLPVIIIIFMVPLMLSWLKADKREVET